MFEFLKRKKKQIVGELGAPLLIEVLDIYNGDILGSVETYNNIGTARMPVAKSGTTGRIRYSMPALGSTIIYDEVSMDVQKVEKGCYIDVTPASDCFVYFS